MPIGNNLGLTPHKPDNRETYREFCDFQLKIPVLCPNLQFSFSEQGINREFADLDLTHSKPHAYAQNQDCAQLNREFAA
jgi:hypothetical protein